MRRYGIHIRMTGSQYVEVDCPNGEDPEEYALDLASLTKADDWQFEVYDVEEVDTDES